MGKIVSEKYIGGDITMITKNIRYSALSLLIVVLLFAGCTYHKAYQGPSLPADKVARIHGVVGVSKVYIDTVDGMSGYTCYRVEVLPGRHTIGVILDGGGYFKASGLLARDFEAGHLYQIYYEIVEPMNALFSIEDRGLEK
jgi:hypothetical protein